MPKVTRVFLTAVVLMAAGSVTAETGDEAGDAPTLVKRASFTSNVVDREPIDELVTVPADAEKVFFFTEITGMEGQTVIHRWILNGETKADVSFTIGGPRWRVFSSKTLVPGWTGQWTVEVLDGDGNKIHEASMAYASG